jgi:hypothetical protein
MGKGLREWRLRHFKKHPFCHWCGIRLRIVERQHGGKQADDEATVDHIRSRLDTRRHEPVRPGQSEVRRVLSCYKCNQQRNVDETALKVEECRRRSGKKFGGSIELAKRPYLERKRNLAVLKARVESGIPGLMSVMGRLKGERKQAGRCSTRGAWLSKTEALLGLRPYQAVFYCQHCNLWHRTTKAALARRT